MLERLPTFADGALARPFGGVEDAQAAGGGPDAGLAGPAAMGQGADGVQKGKGKEGGRWTRENDGRTHSPQKVMLISKCCARKWRAMGQ